jgi:hypothetical protein
MLERALRRDRSDLGALAQAKTIADTIRREQARREHEQIRDPLWLERGVLGPGRAAALAAHDAPRPDLEALTDAQLRELYDRLAAAAVPLDHRATVNVKRLEEQREQLERSINAAERRTATAQAALDTAPRRERAARAEKLDKHLRDRAADQHELERLDRELRAALASPNSPDAWLQHHGAANAQLAQVTVELKLRRERELDRIAQQAITQSPPFVIEAIGDRPTTRADQRHWEHTASKLARWQAEHRYDPQLDGTLGPKPRDFADALRWENLAHDIARTTGRELSERERGIGIEHEL